MTTNTSEELFAKAKNFIPGGVNSPVRAFRSVGGNPIFIKRAKGAYIFDEDDNQYIELINSWGPMILGHAFEPVEQAVSEAIKGSFSFGAPTRREVEMAELIISMVPSKSRLEASYYPVNSFAEWELKKLEKIRKTLLGYTAPLSSMPPPIATMLVNEIDGLFSGVPDLNSTHATLDELVDL